MWMMMVDREIKVRFISHIHDNSNECNQDMNKWKCAQNNIVGDCIPKVPKKKRLRQKFHEIEGSTRHKVSALSLSCITKLICI